MGWWFSFSFIFFVPMALLLFTFLFSISLVLNEQNINGKQENCLGSALGEIKALTKYLCKVQWTQYVNHNKIQLKSKNKIKFRKKKNE